jgi:biotin transport system ATP-binding protein
MAILEVEGLSHRFPDGTVGIEDIDLAVDEGIFTVIAGPNGSGKTTLFRHLNGLLMPTAGDVRVRGMSVKANPRRARQLVGMVFQDADSQIVGETVYDDAAFGPENLKLARPEIDRRVRGALAAVGLSHLADQRPHLLSGGEKRRLAIAGILAMGSEVVVFDEPFSNLDYPGVRQVLAAIRDLHARGRTLLLTTHDLEKVIAHGDRLLIMEKGRIVADGPPDRILPETERYGVRQPCAARWGKAVDSWRI